MIRAAARGVVDFSKCCLRDVNWWRRLNLVLDSLADESHRQRLQTTFDHHCALVGIPGLSDNSFENSEKAMQRLLPLILASHTPWIVATGTDSVIDALVAEYKRTIGDPSDPTFRKKLQQDLARQNREREERLASYESEDARTERLIQERDQRNAERLERLKTRRM